MEDIIIDDRRQLSAKAVTRELEAGQGKRRRILRQYWADWAILALIPALLIIINFTMFAEAGAYSLFKTNGNPTAETIIILSSVLGICFVLSWVFSFALWAQKLLTAMVFGLFIYALFNQFALFDQGSFLSGNLGRLFNEKIANMLATDSHLITSIFAAIIFWIFLLKLSRISLAYFTGIVLFSWFGLLSEAYFNPIRHQFNTVYEPYTGTETTPTAKKNKRFIFIAAPGLPSYWTYQNSLSSQPGQKDTNQNLNIAKDNLLGFVLKNNFILYPNAFITEDNPFLNYTASLNPSELPNPQTHTLDKVLLKSYWDFDELSTSRLYLKNNRLFDSFHKNGYHIKTYQTRGLETCNTNNRLDVEKCVSKRNLPISFEQTSLGIWPKTVLLSAQWLESTGLISNFSVLNPLLKLTGKGADVPSVQYPTSKLYVFNAFKTLDVIEHDINNETADTAYFAVMDIPSDLYIYDAYCRLKPMSDWVSAGQGATNTAQKSAWAQQTSCFIGKLESFMQNLVAKGKLDSSVILIQGLNSPTFSDSTAIDIFEQVKDRQLVTMAIYDPLQASGEINNAICPASSLIRSYLYKKPLCRNFAGMKLSSVLFDDLQLKFDAENISPADRVTAEINFAKWYAGWAETNNVVNRMPIPQTENAPFDIKTELTPEKPAETDTSSTILNSSLPEVSVEELAAEASPKSLSEAMAQNPLLEASPATENQPQISADEKMTENPNEVLKIDSKIELKVKVIDREDPADLPPSEILPTDVIPPFIADAPRTQSQPAEKD